MKLQGLMLLTIVCNVAYIYYYAITLKAGFSNQRKQLFFNQVFQMKNLVIELVKIAGRWVGGQTAA